MHIQRGLFTTEHAFEAGATLPVHLGYETYGTLNSSRSNGVLICHYYTGTSHVAGLSPDGGGGVAAAGWWDSLVGPKKPLDTDRFYFVCMNTLSNVQVGDSRVISTGPETLAQDGLPYGERFPRVDLCDITRLQHGLMVDLGLPSWHAVVGPSYGGIQTLMWGVLYPHLAPRLGVIAAAPKSSVALKNFFRPTLETLSQGEHGLIDSLRLISFCGLGALGIERYFSDQNFDAYLRARSRFSCLSHILSIGNTVSDYDLYRYSDKESLLQTWKDLGLKLFSGSIRGDLFFPESLMDHFWKETQSYGIEHHHIEVESELGHLACIQETHLFAEPLRVFLDL